MILAISQTEYSGQWISPPDRGRIYAWNVYNKETGRVVFHMTGDDADYEQQMEITRLLVTAYNKEYGNGRSLSAHQGQAHRGRWQRFLDYCGVYTGNAQEWRDRTGD